MRDPTETAESSCTAPTSVREINGVEDATKLLRQDGQSVYRWVLENVPPVVNRVLERAGLTLDQIDWFVPHSANLRMIEALCKRLSFPMERTLLQRRATTETRRP